MNQEYRHILQTIGAMGKAYVDDVGDVVEISHSRLRPYMNSMLSKGQIVYGYDQGLYCELTDKGLQAYDKPI